MTEKYKEALEAIKNNDTEKALSIFKEESDKGCSSSAAELGLAYEHGLDVEKDLQKAKEFYELATSRDNSVGAFNLALLYLNGIGTEKDIKQAIKYFRKSSEGGYSRAFYNLGVIYKDIQPNHKNAIHYFTKASENGDLDAKLNLGLYYYFGKGVENNMNKALSLFVSGYVEASKEGYTSELKDTLLPEYERVFRELCGLSESAIKGFTVDANITEMSFDAKENNNKVSNYTIQF